MKVLERGALLSARPIPGFAGWELRRPIAESAERTLEDAFPVQGFRPVQGSAKALGGYLGGTLEVLEIRAGRFQGLAAPWANFLKEVFSTRYAREMSRITGESVIGARPIARFMRYHRGGFLGEHFDNQRGKILTQVFYANRSWKRCWGGILQLLDASSGALVRSVSPVVRRSIINRSSPKARHQVSLLTADVVRKALIVEWYENA